MAYTDNSILACDSNLDVVLTKYQGRTKEPPNRVNSDMGYDAANSHERTR